MNELVSPGPDTVPSVSLILYFALCLTCYSHRLELRLRARSVRARWVRLRPHTSITDADVSEFAAKHGVEAYEAKLERKRLKQLDEEGRRRRTVHQRVPKLKLSPKKMRLPRDAIETLDSTA
jgi:hypothetical protein